jgi:hypothetical protein
MNNKSSTSIRAGAVLLATLLCISLSTSISQAVTNGSLVSDPKSAAPYVVSIWTSEKSNDYKDAEFICTGTLIGPQVVLTAAHCTTLNTPYFVKVGAEALNDNTNFTAVSGVWTSPRYNSKTFANDIGLLKIEERFENIEFPTLAGQSSAKSINKYSILRIFGWGLDQEEVLADLLRTSELSLQDALAVKTFGKSFVPATMLAAGRKIVSENVWSGACNGDSGGPLLSTINGINVIVGVTSWGARNCLPNRPSIFTRVSYFEKDIRQGIKEVEAQSVVVNRTAPIATTEPSLVGRAIPGSELKCSPGVWKNAVSIQTAWTSPARLVGSTKTEVTVLPTDGGSEFKCEIIVASTGASVRRILRTSISGKATLSSEPTISGIGNSTLRSGMSARCEGWNWRIPVDSERITWFTSSSYAPTVPVNGRQIATGPTITFDSNILKGESGRYLICQVTGIKDGFESHFTASKLITTPSAPTLNNVSVSAYSLSIGSSVTCSYSSYGDVETTRIEWGYTSNTGFFNQVAGFAGNRISITSDIARQAAGKALSCRVTLINSGGEVSKIASTYSNFEDLPVAANVTISISGTPEAGKTAYCNATSSNSWSVSTSYQWGKTSFSGSKTIEGQVLSTNSYYTLNSSDITQLGGAYLTCVAMTTNSIGSTASAASISIPGTAIQVPVSAAPTLDLQTPSTTSVAVRIRIPVITGYNASTMKAVLNLVNAPSCRSIEVVPGQAYECAGLSANTTYLADITLSPRTGTGISRASDTLRFTTVGLSSALYVCGQSCTGALSNSAMQYYISDKRLIEASAAPGGPITSSTCTGSGCNAGTAPALPVACAAGSYERTNITANATAQITTHFRYCSAPSDSSAPTIVNSSSTYTGYAPIIPISGPAGSTVAVRFIARDNIGIVSTQARLVNPQNVAVSTVDGTFQVGSVTDGGFIANLTTASSGPSVGDVYQIQAMARDATGNASSWFTLGTFTITASSVDCTISANSRNSLCTNITGLDVRVVRNDAALLRVEFCAISPSTDIWFTGSSPWYGRQVPRAGGGYTIESISLPTGSVKNCASGGFFGFSELASPAAGSTYTIKIDLVNNGVQFSKSFNVSTTADSSGPVITNLAVTPTSISSGQAISVTMKATDAAGVIGCGATVYNVNGIDVVTNSVSTLNSSTGFYTVDIVMNSGNNPGSYTVRGFCNDNNLNKTTTGEIVSFTIAGASVSAISSMPTPITIGINYLDQIVLNGFNFGTISAAPSNYTWTVRTQTASGAVVSNIPTGSNQTYITGLSGSTTYYVYLVATDSAGQTRVSSALVVTTLVPAVTPTMYQFIDPGSVIIPVRSGQTWEIGFKNAISVTLVAKSYGKADITASYAQSCNISTSCVTAVADGDALGKKLYRAMIYPPVDAPRGVLYSLTWIAVSSTGVSTEINSGSFITGS